MISLNPRILIRLGLVAGVLLLVWYTYNQGVEAGINKSVAAFAETKDAAVAKYQSEIQAQADDYNRKLVAIRQRYEAELAEQSEHAADLAKRISEASDSSTEIKERIKYVKSDCSNVGNDAYSLYQRSRLIVNDPRQASSERTTDSNPANQ